MNIMAQKVPSDQGRSGGEEMFLPLSRRLGLYLASEGRGCFHTPPFPGKTVSTSQLTLTDGPSLSAVAGGGGVAGGETETERYRERQPVAAAPPGKKKERSERIGECNAGYS